MATYSPFHKATETKSSKASKASGAKKDNFDPLAEEDDLDSEKEPNELRIALCRARNLRAADHELFGPTSDPRVRFVIQGTEMKKEPSAKSKVIKNQLNPVWDEVLTIKFKASKAGRKPLLTAYVEDWDMVGEADCLGQFVLPLDEKFADHRVVPKKWYELDDSKDMTKKATGAVEASFQWWYNPDVEVFSPFKEELKKFHDPTVIPRPPNELRVGVFRAKGVVADDMPVMGGGAATSDPRVTLTVRRPKKAADMPKPPPHMHPKVDDGSEEKKSGDDEATQDEDVPFDVAHQTAKCSATLRPVWKEMVAIEQVKPPVDKAKSADDFPELDVVIEDVDLTGPPTFLGQVSFNLGPFANQKVSKLKWYPLDDNPDLNTKKYKITGSIELTIHWTYNKSIDPHGDEPRKNESLLSYLTPDFLEDAIESVVKSGQELFYDIMNTMVGYIVC